MKIFGVAVGLSALLSVGAANATLTVLPGNPLFSSYVTNAPDTNSISLIPGGATNSASGSPDAQEFTVASPTTLESITFRLSDATGATDNGSMLVYLVPNQGSGSSVLPSSMGLTLNGAVKLGTILDSSIGSSAAPTNVSINVFDQLTGGTYWIALVNGSDTTNGGTNINTSPAMWWRAGDLIGIDVGNNVGNTDAGLYNAHVAPDTLVLKNATNGAFEMQIDTPEPTSLALLGAGLTGLGFLRRRWAKKAAK